MSLTLNPGHPLHDAQSDLCIEKSGFNSHEQRYFVSYKNAAGVVVKKQVVERDLFDALLSGIQYLVNNQPAPVVPIPQVVDVVPQLMSYFSWRRDETQIQPNETTQTFRTGTLSGYSLPSGTELEAVVHGELLGTQLSPTTIEVVSNNVVIDTILLPGGTVHFESKPIKVQENTKYYLQLDGEDAPFRNARMIIRTKV